MTISNALANKNVATFTKSIAGAVYLTTAIKAVGRPAFIYADKKLDPEAKKYTAGKEFLYQILCLGLTFAMIMPSQRIGFAAAKKHLTKFTELSGIKKFKDFEIVAKDMDELSQDAKNLLGINKLQDESKKALKQVKGGVELGSFVSSILGLTIIAPLISHKILHPVMNYLGMEKKHNDVGKPAEIFLADAKIPTQGSSVNVKA